MLPSQELVSGIGSALSYWEGAIVIDGSRDGHPAKGVGYLEMTNPELSNTAHP
jgi:predicted secreted hydrolase